MSDGRSLLDLPDELLGLVLSHARSDCLDGDGNLLLTCKRFLRAYMSERALWRKVAWSFPHLTHARGQAGQLPRPFAVQDSYLFSKLRLLQRVAGMIEDFKIDARPLLLDQAGGSCEWRADEFVTLLHPGLLRALSIQCTNAMPGSLVRAAGRFTGLTNLCLHANAAAAPAVTAAVLRQLPLLQHLELHAAQMARGTVPALLALQQLSFLELEGPRAEREDCRCLDQLSGLRCLALHGVCGMEPQYQAPQPSALPGLTSYGFLEATTGMIEVGGASLVGCSYSQAGSSRRGELCLDGIQRLTSLRQLLAATVPRGMPFKLLTIQGARGLGSPLPPLLAQPHSLDGCTQLAGLKVLMLFEMASEPAEAELLNRVLEALLPQAPRLRTVTISCCAVEQLPPCLAAATGLRRLRLAKCGLAQLPSGPYLDAVKMLDLRSNCFPELPRLLKAASRLRELQWDGGNLSEADATDVLARLPSLERVVFEPQPSAAVVQCMRSVAPHLKLYAFRSEGDLLKEKL